MNSRLMFFNPSSKWGSSKTKDSLHDTIHCAVDIPTLLASLPSEIEEIRAALSFDHHDEDLSLQQIAELKTIVKAQIEDYSKALSSATQVVAEQIAACTEDECTKDELGTFESIKSENEAAVAKASAMLTAMSSTSDEQFVIDGEGNSASGASNIRAFGLSFVFLFGHVITTL